MKVRCINRDLSLTIDKEYAATATVDSRYFYLINDNNQFGEYLKCRFEIVEENMLKCVSNNVIDDFGSTKIVKRNPLNVNLRTSEIQSLLKELNSQHPELSVSVGILADYHEIYSWFGEFKVETEQDVLEALNEMLKLVKKYKGENDDNGG